LLQHQRSTASLSFFYFDVSANGGARNKQARSRKCRELILSVLLSWVLHALSRFDRIALHAAMKREGRTKNRQPEKTNVPYETEDKLGAGAAGKQNTGLQQRPPKRAKGEEMKGSTLAQNTACIVQLLQVGVLSFLFHTGGNIGR
jgi:hypothetical protein